MKVGSGAVEERVLPVVELLFVGRSQLVDDAPDVLAGRGNDGFLGAVPDRGVAEEGEPMIGQLGDRDQPGIGAARRICSLFMLEP